MKKVLFVAVILLTTTFGLFAQNCNLKGIVRYEYNDYIGYKIDAGAEIYIVSTKKAQDFDFVLWEEYKKLSDKYIYYLKLKEAGGGYADNMAAIFANWEEEDKERLDNISIKCLEQFVSLTANAEYIEIVDESGKYMMQIPYGEYYIIAKSKNRDRPTSTELLGRILIEKVEINKPTELLSFDFDI